MKPENRMLNRVKNAVAKRLGEAVYVEKTNNPFRSGMFDWYVEFGNFDAMAWIEGKYRTTKTAAGSSFETEKAFDMLSPQQKRWGKRALKNGRPAYVLVGFDGTGPHGRTYALIKLRYYHHTDEVVPDQKLVPVVTLPTIVDWFEDPDFTSRGH